MVIAAVLAVVLVSLPQRQQDKYQQWKEAFGVVFGESEDSYRRSIFQQNEREVEEFNKRGESYQKGINQFSHMTDEEFLEMFTTHTSRAAVTNTNVQEVKVPNVPDVDWVVAGKVSPVKNQGGCDAGYAFATTGLLESYNMISKNSSATLLSEQQLVDCSASYGTSGCQGGSRAGAMNYVKDKGIAFDSQYPYKGTPATCKLEGGSTKITGYQSATGCDAIANALRKSPLSIAVDASNWKSYRSGIFSDCTEKVTQDALLVAQTTTYWKVKNSWGLAWGEYGYIRLALGNTCGLCGIIAYWPN